MSDESGRWGPFRRTVREANKMQVLKALSSACEAAMANSLDLTDVDVKLLDAIDSLNQLVKLEALKSYPGDKKT